MVRFRPSSSRMGTIDSVATPVRRYIQPMDGHEHGGILGATIRGHRIYRSSMGTKDFVPKPVRLYIQLLNGFAVPVRPLGLVRCRGFYLLASDSFGR